MTPFSTQKDFEEALGVFVAEFTGPKPAVAVAVLAGVNVLSFGAGQFIGGVTPVMMMAPPCLTDADKAVCCQAVLESIQTHPPSAGMQAFPWSAIPWVTLFQIAIDLVRKYYPNFPWPFTPPAPGPISVP